MLATVELQVRATTFACAVLTALRQNPRCLPQAVFGLQLQRVRFKNTVLRNSKTASFQIYWEKGSYDQGVGFEYIQGKQIQLAVDVTLDIARTTTIAATPNQLVASEFSANATVLFALDAVVSASPGQVELVYRIDDIVSTGVLPPATNLTPQWVKDQLAARLALKPFKLDLSGSIAEGMHFGNAGLAMDISGTVLAIRAEVSGHSQLVGRWMGFHNGNIDNQLGANDWSIVVLADQLEYTLGGKVYDALRDAMGGKKDMLVSVDAQFAPQPGRAVFILTPYFDLPVVGTEDAPISVALSIDTQAGTLIIDIDGYGIRNKVDSFVATVGTILRIFLPLVGPFLSAALHDAAGDAMQGASARGASALQSGLGQIPGAAVEVPGKPFCYRATLPLPTPPLVQARIQELITSPTGFVIAGSWSVLNLTEGELAADCSDFGWQGPKVACGAAGEAVLRDIVVNPKKYAWLLSRIGLQASGTAAVSLCSVAALNVPDPSAGVQIKWASSRLPTEIDVVAPPSLADYDLIAPIELEVRTSIGVLRVQIPPPLPLTQTDIERLHSFVRFQLKLCDAKIKPEWFDGVGHFNLDWIEDPLIDPERFDRQLELVQVEVSGLHRNSKFVLKDPRDAAIGVARADVDGVARMQFAWQPGLPTPQALLQFDEHQRPAVARTVEHSVTVFRQRLERKGTLRVSLPAFGVAAISSAGAPRFIVMQNDRILAVDASDTGRPQVMRQWSAPGLRGAIPVRRGVLAYGDAGIHWLDSLESRSRLEHVCRAVVTDASASSDLIALLVDGAVDVWNAYGVALARLDDVAHPRAVMVRGDQLLVASDTELVVFDLENPAAPRRMESLRTVHGSRFLRSGIDHTIYLGKTDGPFTQLARNERSWAPVAEFRAVPWGARVARSGRTVLHLGDGFGLNVLRIGELEMTSPQETRMTSKADRATSL